MIVHKTFSICIIGMRGLFLEFVIEVESVFDSKSADFYEDITINLFHRSEKFVAIKG